MKPIEDIIEEIKLNYDHFVAEQVDELSAAIMGQDVILTNTSFHSHRKAVISEVDTWSGRVTIRVKIYKKTNRGVLTKEFLAIDPMHVHWQNLIFCSNKPQYAKYLLENK